MIHIIITNLSLSTSKLRTPKYINVERIRESITENIVSLRWLSYTGGCVTFVKGLLL